MKTSQELHEWLSEQQCKKAVEQLRKNKFTAEYCKSGQEAVDYIVKEAQDAVTVGFGGSVTLMDLHLADILEGLQKEVLLARGKTPEERLAVSRRQLVCDLFLTGTNALTLDGYLVNVDMTGNRVGPMFFGPQKVIVVAGRNKLVKDTTEAMARIKSQAAPPNNKRLGYQNPCASTGFCSDCRSEDRICRITTIIERKPRFTDLHVLVVNEDMGL